MAKSAYTQSGRQDNTQEPPAKKKKEYRLLNLINDIINPSSDNQLIVQSASELPMQERMQYSAESQCQEDPLVFWKTNLKRYPTTHSNPCPKVSSDSSNFSPVRKGI